MGGACCIAARDKNIVGGSGSDILRRNVCHSPTWSLRWDNRGRVAGEETSISWFPDAIHRNHGPDLKSESTYVSDGGSPLNSFQRQAWRKSQKSEGTAEHARTPASDQSISGNISIDTNLEQVKEIIVSPAVTNPSTTKLSISLQSTSSLNASPSSSQSHLHPPGSTTPRWLHNLPGNQLIGKVSDGRIPQLKSSNSFSVTDEGHTVASWSNDTTMESYGMSSDGWSMNAFPELVTSNKERLSFDNESLGFNHAKCRSSGRASTSPSVDLQTCGLCLRLLTDKSLWSSQKLGTSNELSVVAVLICGHVYHAECLETLTPELDKYDPACPVCTLDEKQVVKLSQKALKAEVDRKGKNKRSRNRVVDGDLEGNSIMFDHLKANGHEGKGPKMASSSSMKSKSSLAKPFLRRHFSFGSKGSRSLTDSMTKKGFFWTRSMKA